MDEVFFKFLSEKLHNLVNGVIDELREQWQQERDILNDENREGYNNNEEQKDISESDDEMDNESDDESDSESDDESDSESDDESDNESNNESENESENESDNETSEDYDLEYNKNNNENSDDEIVKGLTLPIRNNNKNNPNKNENNDGPFIMKNKRKLPFNYANEPIKKKKKNTLNIA